MSAEHRCPQCGKKNQHDRRICTGCGAQLHAGNAPSSEDQGSPDSGRYIGQMISERYRVTKRLARGGMGEIYLAEHVEMRQLVAVKFLHNKYARDAHFAARFYNEVRYATKVNHPYAVGTFDYGRLEDGTLFIVMEYVRGEPLRRTVRRQGLMTARQTIRIASQMAEVLASAHEKKIIHRDVKPDNVVLVEGVGGRLTIKMLDFGIAKIKDDDQGNHTEPGVMFGTPEYMSPEQARGHEYDHRVDIYALGLVMYYMLAGRPPFCGKNKLAVLQAQAHEKPVPIAKAAKQPVPHRLATLIGKMLEKSPDDRPGTMLEVLQELDDVTKEDRLTREILSSEILDKSSKDSAYEDYDDSVFVYQSTDIDLPNEANKANEAIPPPPQSHTDGNIVGGRAYEPIKRQEEPKKSVSIRRTEEDPYVFQPIDYRVRPLSFSEDTADTSELPKISRWNSQMAMLAIIACTVVILLGLRWVLRQSEPGDLIDEPKVAENDAEAPDVNEDETQNNVDVEVAQEKTSDTPIKDTAKTETQPPADSRETLALQRANDALKAGNLAKMREEIASISSNNVPQGFQEARKNLLRAESLQDTIRRSVASKDCNNAKEAAAVLKNEFQENLAAPFRPSIQACLDAEAASAKQPQAKQEPAQTPPPASTAPAEKVKVQEQSASVETPKEKPSNKQDAPPKQPADDAPSGLPKDAVKQDLNKGTSPSKVEEAPQEKPANKAPETKSPPKLEDVLPPMEL